MPVTKPIDLITTTEARHILDVSPAKMAKLIRDGELRQWTTPLDARKKLVSRADDESLKRSARRAA